MYRINASIAHTKHELMGHCLDIHVHVDDIAQSTYTLVKFTVIIQVWEIEDS